MGIVSNSFMSSHDNTERSLIYKVIKPFSVENAPFLVRTDDILFKKYYDNNFYLEYKRYGISIICELDWSEAMKALRFGWLELVKVEDAEQPSILT